jgi:hypothetical protein
VISSPGKQDFKDTVLSVEEGSPLKDNSITFMTKVDTEIPTQKHSQILLPRLKDTLNQEALKNQSFGSISTSMPNTARMEQLKLTNRRSSVLRSCRYGPGMIPTENLKFDQFVHVAFQSQLPQDEVKQEIINYVMRLETTYTN